MSYDSLIPTHTHNEFLIEYLKQARKLNKDIHVEEKLAKCLAMVEGLEEYLEKTSTDESALQKKLFVDTMNEPWEENYKKGLTMFPTKLEMISTRQSSQFLKTIAEISKAERILEIGLFTGYTAAVFCESAFSKEVISLELDPFLAKFAESRITATEAGKKFKVMVGPGLDSLEKLKKEGKTFDLVFIDADKLNYINYYKFIMDNGFLGPNGVILLDNTLWKGTVYPTASNPSAEAEAFRVLNEFILNDSRVTQVILQVSDGVSMVKVKPA